MNGRVYDYNLGRFLSVDPFIQDPGNSQSLNPYSYIMNNPLAGIDPSGYKTTSPVKVIKVNTRDAKPMIFEANNNVAVKNGNLESSQSLPSGASEASEINSPASINEENPAAQIQNDSQGGASPNQGSAPGTRNIISQDDIDGTTSKTVLEDGSITDQRSSNLEHGNLTTVNGIVLHHTGASTAQSTLNAYKTQSTGAHFLVDENGNIYQTADTGKITWHVGKIRSKCQAASSCSTSDLATIRSMGFNPTALHNFEKQKSYPNRYPMNSDSIGIEIVGIVNNGSYGSLNSAQRLSVRKLVYGLQKKYNLTSSDVYRHGVISYKEPTEGQGFGY